MIYDPNEKTSFETKVEGKVFVVWVPDNHPGRDQMLVEVQKTMRVFGVKVFGIDPMKKVSDTVT
jgi:hypothetical protein